MGYDIYNDKQRINLSNYAYYIISCDSSAFTNEASQCEHISSTFLNRIFLNLCEKSASLQEFQNKEHKSALDEAIHSKGIGFNFTLQKKTQKLLKETSSNYTTAGKYLKSIYEEYALLPYYKREEIYFYQTIRTIKTAIMSSLAITCCYRGEKLQLYPFYIRLDEWSSYNYLIAIDLRSDQITDLRISYMEEAELLELSSELSNIRKEDYKHQIETQIRDCGIQFLRGKAIDITVLLTEDGKNLYDHLCFLRPQYIGKPETKNVDGKAQYLYHFHCTTAQAEYYFFKIGADAVILEPEELRQTFQTKYQKALDAYE